jgi:hypothetical protein
VFYRLISGMHASISCHLTADYLLDEQQGRWGVNLAEFRARLGTPAVRWVRWCCAYQGLSLPVEGARCTIQMQSIHFLGNWMDVIIGLT